MFVTRISRARTLSGRSLIVVLAAGVVLGGAATAEDSNFFDQFHSFVPAKPMAEVVPTTKGDAASQNAMLNGLVAYRTRSYGEALGHFQKAFSGGEPLAAWYLGEIYRLGRGVDVDPAKAIGYYQRVASTYDPMETRPQVLSLCVDAVARLADYYRDGAGDALAADPTRAYQLYSLASSHGHPGAQFGLASMYLGGVGLSRNPAQGVKWLKLAASKRYVPAQTMLGDIYWDGGLVRQDRVRAIMWYTLARQTARPDTKPQISDRLKVLISQATPPEREAGQAKAEKWTRRNGFATGTQMPADAE